MHPDKNVWICSDCLPEGIAVYTIPMIGTNFCPGCGVELSHSDNGRVKAGHWISARPVWDLIVKRLLARITNSLNTMAPHVRQRETARLLSDLLTAYQDLDKRYHALKKPDTSAQSSSEEASPSSD